MARGTLIVRTSAMPGREEEFMDWYANHFAPGIVSLPGFVGARIMRYRRAFLEGDPGGPNAYQYLCIYELDAVDLEEPLRHLHEAEVAASQPRFAISDALSIEPMPSSWLYEELCVVTKQDAMTEGIPWSGPIRSKDEIDKQLR